MVMYKIDRRVGGSKNRSLGRTPIWQTDNMFTRQFSNLQITKFTIWKPSKCAKIDYFTEFKALNHFIQMQHTARKIF